MNKIIIARLLLIFSIVSVIMTVILPIKKIALGQLFLDIIMEFIRQLD